MGSTSLTLEERVEALEKSVLQISTRSGTQWQQAFGTLTDDDMSREADRLGREYRQNQPELKNDADT
jgi:ribosomal protein L9